MTNMASDLKLTVKAPSAGGFQNQLYLTKQGVFHLISKSRSPFAKELANHFGMQVADICSPTCEATTLRQIATVFADEECIFQYSVDAYRIDLYMPKYKLAIECDEGFHARRLQEDEERQIHIEQTLRCKFIRYQPQVKGFDIFAVLRLIYKHLRAC
jgi:very-short-patch-repair endonuclease